jgi:hypothetical protein
MTKQQFVKSSEFVSAVESSTTAGFGGSGYSVEFFKDGSHRVLWDNAVGNAYEHPNSEIVGVPQLTAEQVAEQDDEAGVTLRDVIEFYQDELASEFLS